MTTPLTPEQQAEAIAWLKQVGEHECDKGALWKINIRIFLASLAPDPRKVLGEWLSSGALGYFALTPSLCRAITAQLDAQTAKIAELEASATPQSQAHVAAVENAAERRGRIAEVKYWLDKGLNRFAMSDEFRRRLAELGRTP